MIHPKRTRGRWRWGVLAAAALVGCGGGATTGTTGSATTGNTTSAGQGGAGGASSSTGQGGGASNQISGMAGGKTVDKVAAAYFIGAADDPTHTTVIYVFDTPVTCADLGAAGWDKKVADKTAALEMKLIGTAPAKYPVSTSPAPAQGEAAVNFTLTSQKSTPVESASESGDVVLDVLEAGKVAQGSFDLKFPDGSLKGTFVASWCPGGHEP